MTSPWIVPSDYKSWEVDDLPFLSSFFQVSGNFLGLFFCLVRMYPTASSSNFNQLPTSNFPLAALCRLPLIGCILGPTYGVHVIRPYLRSTCH
ncbi:uncharacterized protein BDW47DRAFT_108951 [Aspergillus candidus]|uniref:Uncharacterized protein n=1 Tax=Aspergillus candidus TaxID=41067 RepID=A0A2I2F6L1_ASPCN|nr:hypothetical protein BDW47DRAFT_108951 [Aspergillus candidus]PLB36208.1 hypothetical protein BDW47DRAFT_108951 [Aspergillus candidus]